MLFYAGVRQGEGFELNVQAIERDTFFRFIHKLKPRLHK